MAEINLIIEVLWIKHKGDCSKCVACEDMIFGNMYNLSLKIANKIDETEISLCESCFTEMNDE